VNERKASEPGRPDHRGGAAGLRRLAAAADSLLTRHGGCTGCTLQKTCGTGMPLVSLYRQAKAPLELYRQAKARSKCSASTEAVSYPITRPRKEVKRS
jgi:hypothetical protein